MNLKLKKKKSRKYVYFSIISLVGGLSHNSVLRNPNFKKKMEALDVVGIVASCILGALIILGCVCKRCEWKVRRAEEREFEYLAQRPTMRKEPCEVCRSRQRHVHRACKYVTNPVYKSLAVAIVDEHEEIEETDKIVEYVNSGVQREAFVVHLLERGQVPKTAIVLRPFNTATKYSGKQ